MKKLVLVVLLVLTPVAVGAELRTAESCSSGGTCCKSIVQNLETRLHALETKSELVVAFYADFGLQPYGGTSIPTNSSIVFQRTLLNLGGAFDEKRGTFITPVSGLYIFILDIVGTHEYKGAEYLYTVAGIFVNGDWKAIITIAFDDTDSCFALVHLSQGDKAFLAHHRLETMPQALLKWNCSSTALFTVYDGPPLFNCDFEQCVVCCKELLNFITAGAYGDYNLT